MTATNTKILDEEIAVESSVKLNGIFMYSTLPIWLAALALIIVGVLILVSIFSKKGEPVPRKLAVQRPRVPIGIDRSRVKSRYLGMLKNLEYRLREGEIGFRPAYQELSKILRDFVKEIGGLDITNCTLSQIREKNIPVLTKLIETFYEPEFAVETDDDVFEALENVVKVIEGWN